MARYPVIVSLRNEAEARLLESVLSERGIPHFLKSYHDSAYDGIFQSQLGWGHLEAPAEYRRQIESIYSDLIAGADAVSGAPEEAADGEDEEDPEET